MPCDANNSLGKSNDSLEKGMFFCGEEIKTTPPRLILGLVRMTL